MGHREQLMAGAKRCLEERGYARTTSRDLAAAAGAPLGTINYHYGSKEALLNAALLETIEEWSDRVRDTSAAEGTPAGPAAPAAPAGPAGPAGPAAPAEPAPAGAPDTDAAGRLVRLWSRVTESHRTDRPMLVATLEALAQAERTPEIREQIAAAFERSRPALAAELHGIDAEDGIARAVGSVHSALIAGLTQQWLIDPERAPTGAEVAAALRVIARSLEPGAEGGPASGSYT